MTPTSSRPVSSSSTENQSGRRISIAAVAAFALFAFTAQPAAAEGAPDAAALWTKNCQSCHGPDGKGKTKAGEKANVRDLTLADVKASLTVAKATEAIKNGIKDKDNPEKFVMKSYADKLSAAEIDALAAHSIAFK